jgi:hypothetical protein
VSRRHQTKQYKQQCQSRQSKAETQKCQRHEDINNNKCKTNCKNDTAEVIKAKHKCAASSSFKYTDIYIWNCHCMQTAKKIKSKVSSATAWNAATSATEMGRHIWI